MSGAGKLRCLDLSGLVGRTMYTTEGGRVRFIGEAVGWRAVHSCGGAQLGRGAAVVVEIAITVEGTGRVQWCSLDSLRLANPPSHETERASLDFVAASRPEEKP